jgi:hypothetical protein
MMRQWELPRDVLKDLRPEEDPGQLEARTIGKSFLR